MLNHLLTPFRAVRRRLLGDYRVESVADVPATFHAGVLYVVADADEDPWAVALLCPCGCSGMIQLALVPGGGPSWSFRRDWLGRPSLHPSVWRFRGCRSHFWLRRGAIQWVPSYSDLKID
jgi:hypothetical protein